MNYSSAKFSASESRSRASAPSKSQKREAYGAFTVGSDSPTDRTTRTPQRGEVTKKQLRATIEKRHKVHFWGKDYFITPRLVDKVFGDGQQLIYFATLDHRPNYYVVCVDSAADVQHNFHEATDDIEDAIVDQFGRIEEDTDDYFPTFPDQPCGTFWGIIPHSEIPWPRKHVATRKAVGAVDPHAADPGKLTPRVADSSEPEIQVMYGELTAREHAIRQAHDWQLAHTDEASRDVYNIIVGLLGLLPFEELNAAIAKYKPEAR